MRVDHLFVVATLLCGVLSGVAFADDSIYGPASAPPPIDEELHRQLGEALKRLEKQERETATLRQELTAEKERRAVERAADKAEGKSAATQVATEVVDKKIAGGRFVKGLRDGLTFSGFLQADFNWRQSAQNELNPSTGQPLNSTLFLIRRARLRMAADFGILTGLIEIDGNTVSGATVRIIGAEISLRWPIPKPEEVPYIQATIGLFKTPFGYEVMQQGDTQRLFAERANVNRALFPGEYDLGVRLSGGWRFLRYAFGVMNGNPAGDKQFAFRDPNQSKDFVGRIGADAKVVPRFSLAGGVSGLRGTGFTPGALPGKDVLVWRDQNENGFVDPGEITFIQGQAATPSKDFDRWAVGADLQLRIDLPKLGLLTVYGEVLVGANLDRGLVPADPIGAGRDLREIGWYAGTTLELTRYALVGVRYDSYNPDSDSSTRLQGNLVPNDSSFSTLAVAAAARYPGLGRLILEYDHSTNHLGRDVTGAPANLKDDAVVVRGEIVF